jgi:flagellar biosynthesis protein FlhB
MEFVMPFLLFIVAAGLLAAGAVNMAAFTTEKANPEWAVNLLNRFALVFGAGRLPGGVVFSRLLDDEIFPGEK